MSRYHSGAARGRGRGRGRQTERVLPAITPTISSGGWDDDPCETQTDASRSGGPPPKPARKGRTRTPEQRALRRTMPALSRNDVFGGEPDRGRGTRTRELPSQTSTRSTVSMFAARRQQQTGVADGRVSGGTANKPSPGFKPRPQSMLHGPQPASDRDATEGPDADPAERRKWKQGTAAFGREARSRGKSLIEILRDMDAAPATKTIAAHFRDRCELYGEDLESLSEDEVKRQIAMYEIFHTELAYLEDLRHLKSAYQDQMRLIELVSEEEMATVFGNLDALVRVHEEIVAQMEALWDGRGCIDGMGSVLLDVAPSILIYSLYCENYPRAIHLCQSLHEENPDWTSFLDQSARSANMGLASFLVKPVQRVCKYPLMVREVLRATPESHQDRTALDEAYALFTRYLDKVNEHKRESEGQQRALEMAGRLTGADDLELQRRVYERRLRRIGQLTQVSTSKNGRVSGDLRHVMLFNDLLLCARETSSGKKLRVVAAAEVATVTVDDVPDDQGSIAVVDHPEWYQYRFSVGFDTPKGKRGELVLAAESQEEKMEWIQALYLTAPH